MSEQARAAARESLRLDGGESAAPDSVIHLDLSYRLPAVCGSDADARRMQHADLDDLDDAELKIEATRLAMSLAFGDFRAAPPWARRWLLERQRLVRRLLKGGDA